MPRYTFSESKAGYKTYGIMPASSRPVSNPSNVHIDCLLKTISKMLQLFVPQIAPLPFP